MDRNWLLQKNDLSTTGQTAPFTETTGAGIFSSLTESFDSECIEEVLKPFFSKYHFDPFLGASERVAIAFGVFESQLVFVFSV